MSIIRSGEPRDDLPAELVAQRLASGEAKCVTFRRGVRSVVVWGPAAIHPADGKWPTFDAEWAAGSGQHAT